MKSISRFKNKKICFLGLGIENISLLEFFVGEKLSAEFFVCDARAEDVLREKISHLKGVNVSFVCGAGYDANLSSFDVIFRSPGYPLFTPALRRAARRGTVITSAMRVFMDFCPTKHIIGVTGSKGKGTTSSLICALLCAQFGKRRVFLGGNIGVAPIASLHKMTKDSFVVLELSSFQLEDFHRSPHVAVLTNLFKEHLAPADPLNPNYHKTFAPYKAAKMNIARFQKSGDYFICNEKCKKQLPQKAFLGSVRFFGKDAASSNLVGDHNKENIAAAWEVAKLYKISRARFETVVKKFGGLPHRIEFVGAFGGVRYFDDSFATTPESAIIALRAFSSPIALFAGGADKGSDFSELAREIVAKNVRCVVLFKGKGSDRLREALRAARYDAAMIFEVTTMDDAFAIAQKYAVAGDIALLSPGCASFGCFTSYKERGDLFKKAVKAI